MKINKSTLLTGVFLMSVFSFNALAQNKEIKLQKTDAETVKINPDVKVINVETVKAKNDVNFAKVITVDSQNNQDPVLNQNYTGPVTKKGLAESPYTQRWFNQRYDKYEADSESLKIIKKNINKYDIEVYMGMWCPDSHREVPGIYKLLEEAGYKMDKLKVYTMNRAKRTQDNFEEGKNISRVPTIVFYRKGKEVNRFVERPRETLAKDIAKIVSGKEYKNTYVR